MIIRLFVFLFLSLTTFKIVSIFLTNFNMFGDEAQYWLWSKSFDFGYYSKPPLIAWFIALYSWFFGDEFPSLKLMPVFLYFLTGFAIYRLCLKLEFNKKEASICCLSFLVIPAVSVSSFFISTDVILLLFWTLSMIALLKIKNDPSSINFVTCGIMVGLAFLSKYAAIYFFLSLSFLCFFDKDYRRLFAQNIFKSALLIFTIFIIVLPNIIWNYNNNWLTLQHTSANADLKNFNPSFFRGIGFLFTQVFMLGIFVFLGAAKSIKRIKTDSQNVFLLCFSLPIILVVFVESIAVKANANWAAVGLVGLFVFLVRSIFINFKLYTFLNFVFSLSFAAVFYFCIAVSYDHKVFDRISGIELFSKEIKNIIGKNRSVVVSDRLLYSNLAYELRGEDINFFMPYDPKKNITKHFQISSPLKKNVIKNFIFIGQPSELSYLEHVHTIKSIKEFRVRFSSLPIKVYEVSF